MSTHFLTECHHVHFANIDSTNSQLINGITSNVLNHQKIHLFTADHQSAGRGQYGRTWVSNKGNVFLSLYIPIGKSQYHLHQLSGMLSPVMGLALSQLPMIKAINQIRKNHQLSPIGVKWANDVGFYDDKVGIFKKLAGILIEPIFKKLNGKSVLVGVVVGVGLNVNSTPVIKNGLYQAVSLKDLDSHLMLTAKDLYADITNAILQGVQTYNNLKDINHLNRFIELFNQHHILTHQYIQTFIQDDMQTIHTQGNCIGIGQDGELLLKNHQGIVPIFVGMAKIIRSIKDKYD